MNLFCPAGQLHPYEVYTMRYAADRAGVAIRGDFCLNSGHTPANVPFLAVNFSGGPGFFGKRIRAPSGRTGKVPLGSQHAGFATPDFAVVQPGGGRVGELIAAGGFSGAGGGETRPAVGRAIGRTPRSPPRFDPVCTG